MQRTPIAQIGGVEAKTYVFEMATRASWAICVDTWPLAAISGTQNPTLSMERSAIAASKAEVLKSFYHAFPR